MLVNLIVQHIKNAQEALLCSEVTSKFRFNNTTINTQEHILKLEANNDIVNYDLFVFKEVAAQIKRNKVLNLKQDPISVNISTKTLHNVEQVKAEVKDIANHLVIEITETNLIDLQTAKQFVKEMKSLGCKIALDDLNHLDHINIDPVLLVKELNPDIVKFVLPDNSQNLTSFIKLIKDVLDVNSSIKIVIEKVETMCDFNKIINIFPHAFIQGNYVHEGDIFIKDLKYS